MKYLKKFNAHSDYLNLLPNDLPNISYCKQEDELHYDLYTSPNKTNFINLYFTTVALESGTIDFTLFSWADTTYVETFAYSKNDGEWVETQNSDNREENIVISVNVVEGDKVRWKGIAEHFGSSEEGDNGGVFTSTCRFNAQGNTMSLLYGDEFANKTTLKSGSEFFYLFYDINNGGMCEITDASRLILPAATLTEYCYYQMFYGCKNLTTAPELPATTLAQSCYNGMFEGCINLTVAPQLPATTLTPACYRSMFSYCTSLTTPPKLPATTLANECYNQMFSNCINLTVAPDLPATTLANTCYYCMFQSCKSLTTAPILSATTLVQSCYQEMFIGCTNLNSVICLATDISANYCTSGWLYNVASNGTFIKADGVNWTTGTSGIPTGWNVYTEDDIKVVKHYELDESELAISAALNDLNSRVSLTEITWAELKELRDNSNLVPGKQYRITDYVTTTTQDNTQSAGHQFDILVMATSVNKLNETAFAIQHSGDTYFANSNLAAWELKYRLDNVQWSVQFGELIYTDDELWFTFTGTTEIDGHTYKLWYNEGFDPGDGTYGYLATTSNNVNDGASTINIDTNTIASVDYSTIQQYKSSDVDGKGTILYMKDEFGNECPYDFKNIQFKRWKATDTISGRVGLNGLYMVANSDDHSESLSVEDAEDYIWAYTFSSNNSGGDQTDFSLGGHDVHDNVFKPYGDLLPNNVIFGRNNYGNNFGVDCCNNSWGGSCFNNSLGNQCQNNSWGHDNYFNSWGNHNMYNTWGNQCSQNSLGDSNHFNSWGCSCYNNSWGSNCHNNSWGNDVMNSTVFEGVKYTQITTENVKNVQVLNGVEGTSPSRKLTLTFAANKTYTQVACLTSAGALKIYVPGDLS